MYDGREMNWNAGRDVNRKRGTWNGHEVLHNECGDGVDHMFDHITRRLLTDALGQDGSLGHVVVKFGILLEDVLEISQDLEHYAHLDFDAVIM